MRLDSSRLIFKFCLGNFPTGYATIAFVRATSFPFFPLKKCVRQHKKKPGLLLGYIFLCRLLIFLQLNFFMPAQIALVSINWGGQISK
jgi:dolichol kinase